MSTVAELQARWFTAVRLVFACGVMLCVTGIPVSSQETPNANKPTLTRAKPSASTGQQGITPAAITALVDQMEQLSDALALGKTDATVRKTSDAVLARLDLFIELQRQAEKNAKSQNASGKKDGDAKGKPGSEDDKDADAAGKNKSGQSEDSSPTASQGVSAQSVSGQAPNGEGLFYGKGQGTVQTRSFVSGGDWGSLPPEKREQAMQTISEKFPPQYRILIEQYFRKIAEEP